MGRPAFDTEFTVCRVHSLAELRRRRQERESNPPSAPRLRAPEDIPTVRDVLGSRSHRSGAAEARPAPVVVPPPVANDVVELSESRTRTANGTVVMNIRRVAGCEPTLDDPIALGHEWLPAPPSEPRPDTTTDLPMWARPTVLADVPEPTALLRSRMRPPPGIGVLRSIAVFVSCAALGGLIALAIATPEGERLMAHLVSGILSLIHL